MVIRSIVLLCCGAVLSACNSSSPGGDVPVEARSTTQNSADTDLLTRLYDPGYTVPATFFVDDRSTTDRSYTLYHVKDSSNSFELCTDDFVTAQMWEAADNESRAVSGVYVTAIENDYYYEFVRELSYIESTGNAAEPTSPGFARVFKCSYIDRSGADRNLRNGYAGRLNASPLNTQAIQRYSEYMWQFTFFWPAQATVIASRQSENSSAYFNTLELGLLTNQGDGACDLVERVDWVFSVDKQSGEISKHFDSLYSMEATLIGGVPQLCAASD